MQELPLLTTASRAILRCCVYDLYDMRNADSDLTVYMVQSHLDEKPDSKLPQRVIEDCILYLEGVGLVCEVYSNLSDCIASFRLTHMGACYFDLEKALKRQYQKQLLIDSFLLPVIVSLVTTILALIISA